MTINNGSFPLLFPYIICLKILDCSKGQQTSTVLNYLDSISHPLLKNPVRFRFMVLSFSWAVRLLTFVFVSLRF